MLPQALAVEEAANDAGPGDEGEEADADSSYDVSAPEDFFASLPPPANVKVRRSRCAHAWQALRWRRLPTVQLLSSQVKTAEYVSSAVDLKSCPKPVFPEFAVIGRSNVGKSSLINMLTGKRKLALVSKQPGAFGGCMLRLLSCAGRFPPSARSPWHSPYHPQARPGASTTSSSTGHGTWWTSQGMATLRWPRSSA